MINRTNSVHDAEVVDCGDDDILTVIIIIIIIIIILRKVLL